MNLYFRLRMLFDYIIPIAIIGIIILIAIIIFLKEFIREHRINKYFTKRGYERHLIGVYSFGDGAFYGWRKDGAIIDDRDLRGMSVKSIKKKYR